MVSRVKIEMSCCYPRKTSNITETVSHGDIRRTPPTEDEADGSGEQSVGQTERKRERESASVKGTASNQSCKIR